MASSEHYSIKQVSEMSGLPSSTLRYYESIGIIPVALLQQQAETLEEEAALLESRRRYVAAKVAYWQAVEAGDQETLASADEESRRRSADLRQAIHTMSKRKDNEDSDI